MPDYIGSGSIIISGSALTYQRATWNILSADLNYYPVNLFKTGGTQSVWDATARSRNKITLGNDGEITFTITKPAYPTFYMGLGVIPVSGAAAIKYSFLLHYNGNLYIYEAGVSKGIVGTYAALDSLKIAVESGVVKYYWKGGLVYTSLTAPTTDLYADALFYYYQTPALDTRMNGEPIEWMDRVNTTPSGALLKTSATAWVGGIARSQQFLASGDGYVEDYLVHSFYGRIWGLSFGNPLANYYDIDYGFYYNAGAITIRERGVDIQSVVHSYGSRYKIAVESGFVKYYKDNVLQHTSILVLNYPLYVEAQIYQRYETQMTDVFLFNFQRVVFENIGAGAIVMSGEADVWPRVYGSCIGSGSISISSSAELYFSLDFIAEGKIVSAGGGILSFFLDYQGFGLIEMSGTADVFNFGYIYLYDGAGSVALLDGLAEYSNYGYIYLYDGAGSIIILPYSADFYFQVDAGEILRFSSYLVMQYSFVSLFRIEQLVNSLLQQVILTDSNITVKIEENSQIDLEVI